MLSRHGAPRQAMTSPAPCVVGWTNLLGSCVGCSIPRTLAASPEPKKLAPPVVRHAERVEASTPDEIERIVLMRIGRKHADEDGQQPETEYRFQLPFSRTNIRVGGPYRRLVVEVVAALAISLGADGTLGVDSLWKLVVPATERIRRLSEDEYDVVGFILRTAKEPYGAGLSEASLRASYTEATLDLDAVLGSLQKKQVLVLADGRAALTI